jgi:hypothetical protein
MLCLFLPGEKLQGVLCLLVAAEIIQGAKSIF